MKFTVIKNINVFMKYAETINLRVDYDDILRFQFKDLINGYIDLDLSEPQEESHNGWNISPKRKPLRIRKRDADMFGSDDFPIPLSCPVTVWAKEAPDTVEHLSYSVPLIGVDCDAKKIYIDRFLERETVSQQKINEDTTQPPIAGDTTDTDRSTVDTKQVIQCIKEVMRTYHSDLSELFEGLLKTVSSEMYAVCLIPHAVERNPTFDAIMTSFLSGFAFQKKLEDVEKYCVKFFNVFYNIGGPFVNAADIIKHTIQDTVRDKLTVQLNM